MKYFSFEIDSCFSKGKVTIPSSYEKCENLFSVTFYLNFVFIFYEPPGGSDGKESSCNAGDLGSIPG